MQSNFIIMRQQQAIGAIFFCLIIAIISLAMILVPRYVGTQEVVFDNDSLHLDSIEHQWKTQYDSRYSSRSYDTRYSSRSYDTRYPSRSYDTRYSSRSYDTVQIRMQYFDPNTADSLTLLQVGFRPWQARAILRYRAKGGKYCQPKDLRRMYGMTDSMYLALEPWITISPMKSDISAHSDNISVSYSSDTNPTTYSSDSSQSSTNDTSHIYPHSNSSTSDDFYESYYRHEKRDTILELNLADTSSLQYLRGIGPVLAKKIVRYRAQLGGFVSVAQLAEINGVPADSLAHCFTVDTTLIRYLNLNHATISQLSNHKYINYDQAKQIIDLRHRRTIRSEADLIKYGIFSRVELDKLRPYLRYEP